MRGNIFHIFQAFKIVIACNEIIHGGLDSITHLITKLWQINQSNDFEFFFEMTSVKISMVKLVSKETTPRRLTLEYGHLSYKMFNFIY